MTEAMEINRGGDQGEGAEEEGKERGEEGGTILAQGRVEEIEGSTRGPRGPKIGCLACSKL